jgi:hypothetical protein
MNAPECPFPEDCLASRILPDGRIVVLVPLLFGRARLCVGHSWTEWQDGY